MEDANRSETRASGYQRQFRQRPPLRPRRDRCRRGLDGLVRPACERVRRIGTAVALACLTGARAAAETDLAAPLCEVLSDLPPEVRSYQPEGVRAQLVMAVTEKFDYDHATLRRVWNEIDAATSARCPRLRTELLQLLEMESLAAALR